MPNEESITNIQDHMQLLINAIAAKGWPEPWAECIITPVAPGGRKTSISIRLHAIKDKFTTKVGFCYSDYSLDRSCYTTVYSNDFHEALAMAWNEINSKLDVSSDLAIRPWFDMKQLLAFEADRNAVAAS